jgi:hypothetical protein
VAGLHRPGKRKQCPPPLVVLSGNRPHQSPACRSVRFREEMWYGGQLLQWTTPLGSTAKATHLRAVLRPNGQIQLPNPETCVASEPVRMYLLESAKRTRSVGHDRWPMTGPQNKLTALILNLNPFISTRQTSSPKPSHPPPPRNPQTPQNSSPVQAHGPKALVPPGRESRARNPGQHRRPPPSLLLFQPPCSLLQQLGSAQLQAELLLGLR